MQPTMEILERMKKNSAQNKDEVFTRLYRYLLRPDLYFIAYQHLYGNNGASTKGINSDTADGFSEEKIAKIIASLRDGSYQPSPSRRTYIKKANGKMRPLGIPTFTDRLIQEVLRMILEAIYEPIFLNCSHGFRSGRSCHTALSFAKQNFTGARWFVEGDIKGCFDNIDHQTLLAVIGKKVKDARLLQLIGKLLKAGYSEDFKYHNTYSGTPQGGIISPLLSNIYLHELDQFMAHKTEEFEKPAQRKWTPEYTRISGEMTRTKQKIEKAKAAGDIDTADMLLKRYKELRGKLLKTPCKSQTDKKIRYVRYADDFLIAVNGSKEDCQKLKAELSAYIREVLKMELSDEKTLITHSSQYARFLGYDIRVRRSQKIKPNGRGTTQRTLSNQLELAIPLDDKIMKFLYDNHIVQGTGKTVEAIARTSLMRLTDLEVVSTYNAELRGICNYYNLASNFYKLHYFSYLMEYSCLKTLAAKYDSSMGKIKEKNRDKSGGWCIPYETKTRTKALYLAKHSDCAKTKHPSDIIPTAATIHKNTRSRFEDRLKAKVCELCGTATSERYEIHHVNKIKNLKGKAPWEIIMLAKRRKTMVLCYECHKKIHGMSSEI